MSTDALGLEGQRRLLDGATGAVMITASVAILVAWSVDVSSSALAPAATVLLVYAAGYALVASREDEIRARGRLPLATALVHLSLVPVLAAIWLLLGPAEFPLFLVVFALPVATAALVPIRAHPFTTALLSLLCVAVVAALTSPEFRWYAGIRAPMVGVLLDQLAGLTSGDAALGVPGRAPPHGVATLVVWMGIGLIGLAMAVSSLATVVPAIRARLRQSSMSVRHAARYARDVLQACVDPAVVVSPEDGRIVRANARFRDQVPGLERGKTLAEALQLPDPRQLDAVLAGGELPSIGCRLANGTRICRISARPVRHGRRRMSLVTIQDRTDHVLLDHVVGALGATALVLTEEGSLLYATPAAVELFEGLEPGTPAQAALSVEGTPEAWWDPAPRRKHERAVTVAGSVYTARLRSTPYPGRADRFTVVSLTERGPR